MPPPRLSVRPTPIKQFAADPDIERMTTLAAMPPQTAASHAVSDGRLVRWIIAAALLSGFCYLLSPAHEFEDGFSEETHIARHLAHGDGFLSPFDDTAHALPTSWCPPIYPWVMAIAYRICGEQTVAAQTAIVAFNILCRAASAAALFMLGRQIFDRNVGALAAGLMLLHPMFLHVVDSMWDNCLGLAMFLWILHWALRLRSCFNTAHPRVAVAPKGHIPPFGRIGAPPGRPLRGDMKPSLSPQATGGILQFALLGAALGVLLLTNTSYVLTCPAIVFLAAGRQPWRRRVMLGVVAAGAAALVLLPWTLRNEHCFGRLMLVRGNLNTELWLANQPCSYGWMTLAVLDSHPSRDAAEHRLVLENGETSYFAECGRRFIAEYRADPDRFWLLCGERFVHAFITDTGRTGAYIWPDINIDRYLINGFVVAAGLGGAWTMWRLKKPGVALLGIALLAVAPYFVAQLYNRYAMPLRAILVLFAAYLIVKLARWNASIVE
jgi:4-amino-4-deoxy-L-arabinose transferase-like glycosyltransferase